MKTIKLKISGMTCDHCALSIEKRFDNIEGIQNKKVSYPLAQAEFTFESKTLSENEIINTINSTKHFKVVVDKENTSKYDLIIIGGGSAAFSAAIKAESLGKTTLMINGGLNFGGTCVNVGCVPSKNIIRAAETAHKATHSDFKSISPKGFDLNYQQLIKDKKELVAELQQKKYLDVVADFEHLKMLKGWAKFIDKHTIVVDDSKKYTAEKFLIASGSTTNIPSIEGIESIDYLTNIRLFDREEQPKSLTILGAGYIGLEIAMAFNRLGTKVRIIEFTNRVLRSQTEDISLELQKHMENEGIEFFPNYRVQKFEKNENDTLLHIKKANGDKITLVEKGNILIATGTKANTDNLGIENIGVELNSKGNIIVNNSMETNIENIYAAGDVANTKAFVYTAASEGNTAITNAFSDQKKLMDYSYLPWLVFTDPQIAGVGLDEEQAASLNIPFEISKIDLKNIPRSIAANDTRGFIKLIRNTENDQLIGARIVAPEGGELVQHLSLAIKHSVTINELAETIYPYLTLSEGIKLAAITFGKDISKLSCCAS